MRITLFDHLSEVQRRAVCALLGEGESKAGSVFSKETETKRHLFFFSLLPENEFVLSALNSF